MAEEKKPKKKWMKSAVEPAHKGVFKEKAERAGKSTTEFAAKHAGDKGKLGKEARLAETFAKMRPKTKSMTKKMYGRED